MIVTVTLNAALDRSLTVPTLQLGQRHRASDVLTLAGGKGINVARALKRLDVPVVATGLAGGRTGTRIVEELTGEAILNDFVRIGDESRTSTLVVDPTSGTQTEINEWGPKVTEAELGMLMDKLRYLSRGADAVVFAGSLPRGRRRRRSTRRPRASSTRRGVRVVLDTEGEPLRLGLEAEPWLVVAEPARGRAARRAGAGRRGRLPDGARRRSPSSAPATSTSRSRAAASRSSARSGRCGATASIAPRLEPVSVVGAGDALPRAVAQRRCSTSASAEEALRARGRDRRRVGARGRRGPVRPGGGAPPRRRGRGARAPARRRLTPARPRPRRERLRRPRSDGATGRARTSSRRKASPSTTSCSCRPSRRCSRTTSSPRRG